VRSGTLPTRVRSSEYRIHFEDGIEREDLQARIDKLIGSDTMLKSKEVKGKPVSVNVRPLVYDLHIDEAGDLIAHLTVGDRGNVRPDEILTEMGLADALVSIHRYQLHIDPEPCAEFKRLLTEHGTVQDFETRMCRKDGSEMWIALNARVVYDASGTLLYYEGTTEAITARKQAEEALRLKNGEVVAMSQQLWQAAKLATVGELAASIAHELNNPLATVSLRVESLLARVPEHDPKRRALEVIEQEVERMGHLVANLLQFSRRDVVEPTTLELGGPFERDAALVAIRIDARQIRIAPCGAGRCPVLRISRN